MTKTKPTKAFPRDIHMGQEVKVCFRDSTKRSGQRWQWRTVLDVEKFGAGTPGVGWYSIWLLDQDGEFRAFRVIVAANSRHEVKG
jgi:hypothetical protein